MTCPRCGGFIWTRDLERGPYCMNCGRSPEPPPTRAQLRAAGVYSENMRGQEAEGQRKRGMEYMPSNGDSNVLRRFKSR